MGSKQDLWFYLHQAESPEYGNIPRFMHYIATIANSQNQGYSIPMFSNEISGYWDFELQDKNSDLPPCHTTFEKEFLTAVDSLGLNDSFRTDQIALSVILMSLTNCNTFAGSDIDFLSTEQDYWYRDLECGAVLQKSFETVLQNNEANSCFFFDMFWDRNSERIYQVEFDGYELPSYKRKVDISIKVHNVTCEPEE